MAADDIVTRLRAYNIGNIVHEASFHMEETLYEAADEIERLRELVADYKKLIRLRVELRAAVGDEW